MADKKSYFDEPSDFTAEDEIILHEAQFDETTTSRGGTMVLRCSLAVGLFVVFAVVALLTQLPVLGLVGLVAAALLFSCTHVILEWERAVVLRGGKFHRVAGPGLFFMVPLLDSVTATVDTRMRSTAFKAEHVLTADLVPVDVDAVLFWAIFDAEKACSEVKNYVRLVYWVAQTTLRDVMGAVTIAQLSTRRTQIDREVKEILEKKTSEYGITVLAVEIRDIEVPEDLQEALSAEARAERESNARVMLAEVEREVSDIFVEAAETYGNKDAALQLRAMSFVADSVKERGGTVVIPSVLSEAFEGLGKLGKL
ncbi:MAG: slipin family protein [Eggerthellaceae bacterium]|nr:slipin family protein [Eggerthellaceae bacterium]